jgi:hypothetical protein
MWIVREVNECLKAHFVGSRVARITGRPYAGETPTDGDVIELDKQFDMPWIDLFHLGAH